MPPDDRQPTVPDLPPPPESRGVGRLWRRADASVRLRVLAPTGVLFALIIALMAFVAVRLSSRDHHRQQEAHSMVVARLVRAELSAAMLDEGPAHVPALLDEVVNYRADVTSISLIRPDGRVVMSSQPEQVGANPWGAMDRFDAPQLVHTGADDRTFAVIEPIPNKKACIQCHERRQVGATNGWLDVRVVRGPKTDWHLVRVLVLTAVPMLFVLLGILWWLLGREVVGPIGRLIGTMRLARRGSDTATADEGRADELGEVARSFDATFAALRRAQREVEHFYRERSQQVDRFAAVGELATGLAHEIKNPLAGLSGALEVLGEDLSSPMQVEIIGEMRNQLARLTQTMNSMLNFARPPKVRLRPTSVRDCVSNMVFLVRQHVRKHGDAIALEVDIADELPPALADPAQLEQALLNVALNAVQAMGDDGGRLAIRVHPDHDQIAIEIADTGPGIPDEVRERIFEPYFTTKGGGTGLGLALTARIISYHSGNIEYECPPAGGTTFHISLKQALPTETSGIAV